VPAREPWKLSLVVDIDVDVIVNVVSGHELGSKFGVDHSDNVMIIDVLNGSPVACGVEVSLVCSGQLLLEKIHMSLRNRIDGREDVPVN
jgi:hypothetical protein